MTFICDGTRTNKSTMQKLRVVFSPDRIQRWFCHPSDHEIKVNCIFDYIHMLKLMRNLSTDKKILTDNTLT